MFAAEQYRCLGYVQSLLRDRVWERSRIIRRYLARIIACLNYVVAYSAVGLLRTWPKLEEASGHLCDLLHTYVVLLGVEVDESCQWMSPAEKLLDISGYLVMNLF